MPNRLPPSHVYCGNAPDLIDRIGAETIALAVWSPPYHVGKSYEQGQTFDDWKSLLSRTIASHFRVLKPGGFLAINIADILCFPDDSMPRVMSVNLGRQIGITREQVQHAKTNNPTLSRQELAELLGCSEQTVDRRLNGNNIRGGKYQPQTRIQLVGHLVDGWAREAGLHLYDRRVWVKDPTWANSQWHSTSYRAVGESEDVYIFWKPGETVIDRTRLGRKEWADWGSRQVWQFPSVRANDDHPAKFPEELPSRLIRLLSSPGDVILDCFAGSGTTLVAAKKLGRRFIGIDLMPEYVQLAEQKLATIGEQNE